MKKWTVDSTHSEVGFSVKHMMISKVKGSFGSYEATVEANEEDLSDATIFFKIDVGSINTNNTDRDNHLRSPDFFDTDQFPYITFTSQQITQTEPGEYELLGNLTIKDVTLPVTFEVEYGGKGTNPWGIEVVAFEAEGKINRKDFGLTWNQTLEAGGVLVGDEIKIHLAIEANPVG